MPMAYWKVDNGKADTKQNSHGEPHQALSTNIIIQFYFYVLHQVGPEGSLSLREDAYEVFDQSLVIEQDKEQIQQRINDAIML